MYKITLTRVEHLEFKTRKEMMSYVRLCGAEKINLGEEVLLNDSNNSISVKYDQGRKEKEGKKGNCY